MHYYDKYGLLVLTVYKDQTQFSF